MIFFKKNNIEWNFIWISSLKCFFLIWFDLIWFALLLTWWCEVCHFEEKLKIKTENVNFEYEFVKWKLRINKITATSIAIDIWKMCADWSVAGQLSVRPTERVFQSLCRGHFRSWVNWMWWASFLVESAVLPNRIAYEWAAAEICNPNELNGMHFHRLVLILVCSCW